MDSLMILWKWSYYTIAYKRLWGIDDCNRTMIYTFKDDKVEDDVPKVEMD